MCAPRGPSKRGSRCASPLSASVMVRALWCEYGSRLGRCQGRQFSMLARRPDYMDERPVSFVRGGYILPSSSTWARYLGEISVRIWHGPTGKFSAEGFSSPTSLMWVGHARSSRQPALLITCTSLPGRATSAGKRRHGLLQKLLRVLSCATGSSLSSPPGPLNGRPSCRSALAASML